MLEILDCASSRWKFCSVEFGLESLDNFYLEIRIYPKFSVTIRKSLKHA